MSIKGASNSISGPTSMGLDLPAFGQADTGRRFVLNYGASKNHDRRRAPSGTHQLPQGQAGETDIRSEPTDQPDARPGATSGHARVGNTGAASPFVQWALAAIATHHQKNASLTVNLRRNDEATITAVTPSPDSGNPKKTNPLDFKLAP